MTKTTICLATILAMAGAAQGQELLLGDNYNVANVGSGFTLGNGVNSGINPPTTRLTGSLAGGMRYIDTALTKSNNFFTINANRIRVQASANSARFTFSSNGSTPHNFAPSLGSSYDITISIGNTAAGTQRCSFALGTVEDNANFWDFGIQLYRAVDTDTFYTIGKRIDTGSSGLASDQNAAIGTTALGTAGSMISFFMRVTDAGAESGSSFSSRIQLSLDGGDTFFYDTATDASLVNGFRFDGSGRYIMWDAAGQAQALYDNFSLTAVPEPSTMALAGLGGAAMLWMHKRRKTSDKQSI